MGTMRGERTADDAGDLAEGLYNILTQAWPGLAEVADDRRMIWKKLLWDRASGGGGVYI
jgi:hypothetical protein